MILTQWIIDSPINKHFRRNYVQGAAAHSGKLVLFRCGTPIKPYKIDIFVGHVWKTSPKIYLPLNTGSTLAALAEGPSCIKLMHSALRRWWKQSSMAGQGTPAEVWSSVVKNLCEQILLLAEINGDLMDFHGISWKYHGYINLLGGAVELTFMDVTI